MMKKLYFPKIVIAILLSLLISPAWGQLSGIYTINKASPTSGTNFNSITDFTDELALSGVSGPVVANIVSGSGPYTETMEFGNISGASATNTIRVNGNGETVQYNGTSSKRQMLVFNNTHWVTVDNVHFKTLNSTYGWAAWITNNSSNDSIINCDFNLTSITGTSSSSSSGIVFSGSSTSATSSGSNGSNIYIGNNNLYGTTGSGGFYYGIALSSSSSYTNDGNIIENNTISNFYYYGIRNYYTTNTKIIGNNINRSTKTSVTTFYGIYNYYSSTGLDIRKNDIHSPVAESSSSSSTFYGIYLYGPSTTTNPFKIYNNTINNINGSLIYALYISNVGYGNVFHNTINLDNDLSSSSTNYCIYASGSNSGLYIKNNLVNLTGGGSGTKYGFYYSTTSSINDVQRNNIYVNSTSGTAYYGYLSGTYTSMAAFQTAYPAYEVGSTDDDPMLTSPATGDVTPMNTVIANAGTNLLSEVSDDIDGDTRSTTPTPGCQEIEALINDISAFELVSPVNFCAGSNTVSINVINMGTNVVNNYKVNWSIDGVLQTPVSVTTALGVAGSATGTATITLGTYTFPSGTTDLVIWTSDPNGVTDANTSNDTLSITVEPAMSGTYTINSGSPTSGTNFSSIADFTNALETKGICGPVVANIIVGSGPYNETVTFTDIDGASAVNTIRLNGNGETVQFSNTSSNRQMLVLNGAKYVIIDSIYFKTLSSSYGWGAAITNGAYMDSIINCYFDLSATTSTSSSNSSGISFTNSLTSATSGGNNGSNIYIGNNTVMGPTGSGGMYYGLTMYGSSTNANDSNVVEGNTFQNFYYYGVYIYYATNLLFKNNDINRKTKTSVTTFYGIYTSGYNYNTKIWGNRIHDPSSSSVSSSYIFRGIYSFGDASETEPMIIANNAIYNVVNSSSVYGIYFSTVYYNLIYHNTVNLDNSTTSTSYGMYFSGTNTGTMIKNNLVNITNDGYSTKYGVYYSSGTSSFEDLQGNNIYVNSTSGSNYWGYLSGTFATLADFQASYPSFETTSISEDPEFISPATGNLKPDNKSLAVAGVNVLSTVPTDILDEPRTVIPTPGAFQIQPLNNNAAITKLISPHAFCTGDQPIIVRVYNYGANDITSLTVNYTLDGVLQPAISLSTTLHALTDTDTPKYIDLTLTTYTFTTAPLELVVWTKNPNGTTDTDPSNDTLTATLQSALGGYYTINSSSPTLGTNYNTISEFTDDLHSRGVCSSVEAEIIEGTGPYEEFVEFKLIPGISATKTVRLYGHMDTVQYTNTYDDRQLLILDGAKYVTIENIAFKSLSSNYGWAALITGGSKYDTIRDCYFDLTNTTTTSSTYCVGITFSGSRTSPTTAGDNGSHIYLDGNTLMGSDLNSGPYYGLTIYGNSNYNNDSNTIINNKILNFYYYGIYLYYVKDLKFIGNTVSRAEKAVSSTFYGVYMNGTGSGNEIRDNWIHGGRSGSPTSSTFYGILMYMDATSSNPNIIANNAIYNMNQGGTIYGIYGSSTYYNEIYHNTVSIHDDLTSSSSNYGIYLSGSNTGTTVQNNLVNITGGGTGSHYGFYYSSSSSVNNPQRNMFWVDAPSGTNYYGYYMGAYANIAAFQTAYPTLENGSISVDPELADPVSGALMPSNTAVDGIGLDLTAIVPTDIMGTTRPALPTPGVWEVDTTQLNNAMALEFIAPEDSICEGEHEILMVVQNLGLNGINSMTINYDVDGTTGSISYTGYIPGTMAAPANKDTISLGNFYFTNGVPVYVTAYTYYPNSRPDNYPANDTVTDTFLATSIIPVDIGPSDTSICKNHSITLDAGYAGERHIWNTGDTTQTIDINAEGVYDVVVITSEGCYGYDTLNLTHIEVVVDLSYDDTPCVEDSLVLDAGNPGSTYFWNTGDTTQTITVFSPGEYIVLVTTEIGCVEMDTVTVVFEGNRPIGDGIDVEGLGTFEYKFKLINPEHVVSYAWDFGDGSPISYETSPTHTYTAEGTYKVTLTVYSTCGEEYFYTFTTIFTGIDNPGINDKDIYLYPNPASHSVTIERTGVISLEKYTIYNNLGQIVKQDIILPGIDKKKIDLSEVASGTYHILIQTDKGAVHKTFSVVK